MVRPLPYSCPAPTPTQAVGVFPAARLLQHPFSLALTGPSLLCSAPSRTQLQRSPSLAHPVDRVALGAPPPVHLLYHSTRVRLLFSLSQPVALCPHRPSFRIKRNLSPTSSVFKQAILSFLMCFQLGFAIRLRIYCSGEAAGVLCALLVPFSRLPPPMRRLQTRS